MATGEFRMAGIRKASLDAHAAARDAKEEDAKAPPMLQGRRWQRLTFPPMPWAAPCMESGLLLPVPVMQMMV